jgi:hypothetical protein
MKKNDRARLAIYRIDDFQKKGILNILSITPDSVRNAYADPLLIEFLVNEAKKGNKCTFFSDDKELNVRVRQHLIDVSENNWHIVELRKSFHQYKIFVESLKEVKKTKPQYNVEDIKKT